METKKRSAITIRLDSDTKNAARQIFDNLGMDLSTGINIYLKQVIKDKGLPFKPSTINSLDVATELAHEELQNGQYRDFDNLDDLFKDLHEDN
jgi:DNA-damage-inducible protein J